MNSFLQLQEQDLQKFEEEYQDDVRDAVSSRLRTLHFVSDVLEHFFPRLSDTMTLLAGGEVIDPDDPYLTVREDDEDPAGPPLGPGRR